MTLSSSFSMHFTALYYCLDVGKLVRTEYLSKFTMNSHKCNYLSACTQLDSYCEIIEIHATEEGSYIITSESAMNMQGFICENNFTLFDLNINLIKRDDNSHYNKQFKMEMYCKMNTSFILIATTSKLFEQNLFSIIVSGPSSVSMQRISMCV